MSGVYLDESDFKGSFNAIAEANMTLSKFEELFHTQDVADFLTLSEFLKSMKDDLYKNMQSRFVDDLLLNEIIEDPTVNTTFRLYGMLLICLKRVLYSQERMMSNKKQSLYLNFIFYLISFGLSQYSAFKTNSLSNCNTSYSNG